MLKITSQAAGRLYQELIRGNAKDELAMRITSREGRLTWFVDFPHNDDRVFTYEGKPVVVIEKEFLDSLGDAILDVKETERGPTFFLV